MSGKLKLTGWLLVAFGLVAMFDVTARLQRIFASVNGSASSPTDLAGSIDGAISPMQIGGPALIIGLGCLVAAWWRSRRQATHM